MITSFKIQTLSFEDDIQNLLCEIDKKLSSNAKRKLDSLRFGTDDHLNMTHNKMLSRYRDIVVAKASGSKCFCDFSVDEIISNIKYLLNK